MKRRFIVSFLLLYKEFDARSKITKYFFQLFVLGAGGILI